MPFAPTQKQRTLVSNLVAFGLTQAQIASLITQKNGRPLSRESLEIHFKQELAEGLPKANAQVAGSLFKSAVAGNTTAQIFWLKSRAHWKETSILEVGGIPGQPIEMNDARTRLYDKLDQTATQLAAVPRRGNGAAHPDEARPPTQTVAGETG